jgi:hypothetical protein
LCAGGKKPMRCFILENEVSGLDGDGVAAGATAAALGSGAAPAAGGLLVGSLSWLVQDFSKKNSSRRTPTNISYVPAAMLGTSKLREASATMPEGRGRLLNARPGLKPRGLEEILPLPAGVPVPKRPHKGFGVQVEQEVHGGCAGACVFVPGRGLARNPVGKSPPGPAPQGSATKQSASLSNRHSSIQQYAFNKPTNAGPCLPLLPAACCLRPEQQLARCARHGPRPANRGRPALRRRPGRISA